MSIYQRGENWYIDFVFKGQRVRESIGPSRKDAEKVIAKRKTEIVENKYLDIRKDPDPVRFHDFAKEYLQWAKANKKLSSYARDLYTMRTFDREFAGKTIQEITTWQIEKYKSKRKELYKPASVNRELALLKHMFTKAIEWKKVKEDPAKKVKLFRGKFERVRYLMPDEVQTVLSNCEDFLRPIVTVAVHTGMRKGELMNLKWNQVNFNQGIISLFETKNHKRRDIEMNETVRTALLQLEPKGDLLFTNGDGRRISFQKVFRAFREALEKSKIEDFRFHDLRHTFASNLVMAGEDLNTVRELLGHKDMSMTLRYAHLGPKFKKRAVNVLDKIMAQIPEDMAQIPPQAEKVVQLRP